MFATNNQDGGNLSNNIAYPEDIEGVWCYLYYSFSKQSKRVVGFIRYGDAAPQRTQFDTLHPIPMALQFLVGKDKFYPGINGQFKNIAF